MMCQETPNTTRLQLEIFLDDNIQYMIIILYFQERGGISTGMCAGGFGVCCTFSARCGGRTQENSTYLTTDTSSSSCTYTVCPCNHQVITQLSM